MLSKPLNFDAFLERLGPKDRLNAERHLAACEAEADPRHGRLWRRMACTLMSLTPHSAKLNGRQSMQFYIADGKYRMQVFALEDASDGHIAIYLADVRDEAAKAGVLSSKHRAAQGERAQVPLPGSDETLDIEALNGRSVSIAPFYKDMLGWNRTAIRVMLPFDATAAQITAAEELCALSAQKWLAVQAPA